MIIQICSCVTWMITEWTDEWLLRTMNRNVILKCLGLIRFIIAMRTMKLENSRMSIFTVKHLIKSHVSIPTLIAPRKKQDA